MCNSLTPTLSLEQVLIVSGAVLAAESEEVSKCLLVHPGNAV